MFDLGELRDVVKDLAGWAITGALGYTLAVWRKPSMKQMADAIAPVVERVTRLETKTDGHVTRVEFKEAMTDLKAIWSHNHDSVLMAIQELRTDVRDIRRE